MTVIPVSLASFAKLRRKLVTAAAAAVLVVGGSLVANVATPSPALAHGASMVPASRQFACWLNADTGGVPVATNPACQSVLAQAGENWFWNWFGNLHSSNDGGTVGSIPDGRICDGADGGPYDFTPFNQVRDDWPYTRLTAGSTIEFRHNDWAHHPGDFNVYVTEQGWNSNTPLAWSELELVHTETNPPQVGGSGLGYYSWNVTLPSNRSGEHIIFVHWVRSDSPEDFFSCSDVRFDGGNGELVFPGTDQTSPPPTTGSPPPTTGSPPVTTSPPPAGDCTVAYDLNDWGSGFQADVTITNDSSAAINSWNLDFSLPSGSIDQVWSAVETATGVSNASWNGTIPGNGGTANFGLLGSPGGVGTPSSFTLNGTACAVA